MKKMKRWMIAGAMTAVMGMTMVLGTFAWQSISQEALNKSLLEKNPGGRIHDDFNGEDKFVYAENFTDAEDGVAVFVRIRLDEYLETGPDAGTNFDDPNRDAKALAEGSSVTNEQTWRTHAPDSDDDEDPFHDYYTWNMGGSTIYMPTFNKNKDSLAVDINGTYEGKDDIRYGDYYPYSDGEPKTADAYYDADPDTEDEGNGVGIGDGGEEHKNYEKNSETHTAAKTQNAKIMSMTDWKQEGCPVGPIWVWDEDGWYYWAEPLYPEKTTGCLLNGISPVNYNERTYYVIKVIGQFATANDWGSEGDTPEENTGFYKDGITQDALGLLEEATKVVLGKEDGELYKNCGANTYRQIREDGTLSDLICAGADMTIGTKDDKTNVIELSDDLIFGEGSRNYGKIFLTPDADSTAYRAVGQDKNLGTADDEKLWYTGTEPFPQETGKISTVGADTVNITAAGGASEILPAKTLQFSAKVTLKGVEIDNQKVTWKLTGGSAGTSIDASTGILTVASEETAGTKLSVYAVSNEDSSAKCEAYTLTVLGPDKVTLTSSDGTLLVDAGSTLKLNVEVLKNNQAFSNQQVKWSVSGNAKNGTSVSDSGVLIVDANEPSDRTLTITATSVNDSNKSAQIQIRIPILKKQVISTINGLATPEGSTTTVTIDGIEWYILKKDTTKNKALLLSKYFTDEMIFDASTNIWKNSSIRAYLNGTWLSNHQALNATAVATNIYTISASGSISFTTTSDRVFLLSEADLNGTSQGTSVTNAKYYTTGSQLTAPGGSWRADFTDGNLRFYQGYWLRSCYTGEGKIAAYLDARSICGLVLEDGAGNADPDYTHPETNQNGAGIRPALWIELK